MTDILTWDEDTYKEGTYGHLIFKLYTEGYDTLVPLIYIIMNKNKKKFEDEMKNDSHT